MTHSRTILLLTFAAFASAMAVRICDPLLPALASSFATSTVHAAQAVTVFAFAYGALQLVYGPLGDRFDKLRIVSIACLGCMLAALGGAASPSLNWLLGFRLMNGAAAAAVVPVAMAWIGDRIPYQDRQAVLARFLTGGISGLIAGQFIGGLFADLLGWRSAFVFLALIYGSVGVLLWLRLGHPSLAGGVPPRTERAPLLHGYAEVLGSGWPRLILLVVFLEGALLFGAITFIPTYLHSRFGLSLTAAGGVLALFGLGGLCYTFSARRLIGGIGERGMALAAGLALGSAFALFLLMGSAWLWAAPAIFLAGLGYYMLHNTLQTHATQMTPSARGTAVALFAASLFLGNAAGVACAALLIESADILWVFAIAAVSLPLLALGFRRGLLAHARG